MHNFQPGTPQQRDARVSSLGHDARVCPNQLDRTQTGISRAGKQSSCLLRVPTGRSCLAKDAEPQPATIDRTGTAPDRSTGPRTLSSVPRGKVAVCGVQAACAVLSGASALVEADRGELFGADDVEEREVLCGVAAGRRGVKDDAVVALGREEHLTVEVDGADHVVEDPHAGVPAHGDFVEAPQLAELLAGRAQALQQLGRGGVRTTTCDRGGPQIGDVQTAVVGSSGEPSPGSTSSNACGPATRYEPTSTSDCSGSPAASSACDDSESHSEMISKLRATGPCVTSTKREGARASRVWNVCSQKSGARRGGGYDEELLAVPGELHAARGNRAPWPPSSTVPR